MSPDLQIVVTFAFFSCCSRAAWRCRSRSRCRRWSICCCRAGCRPQQPGAGELGQHEQLHADLRSAVHADGGNDARSGLSSRIYRGLAKLVARLPGGLLQTNIVGCALFASVSGSSIATAASIGGVALPQLVSRNYDRELSAGSLAAGGTLGILLPPSIAMIIYGTFTETSVPKLFMAGVIPGVMLTRLFMTYIGVHALLCRPWRRAKPGRARCTN